MFKAQAPIYPTFTAPVHIFLLWRRKCKYCCFDGLVSSFVLPVINASLLLCMLIGYSGHVVLPCGEFTVSAIKRSQLCLLVSSRLLFSPNTTAMSRCCYLQSTVINSETDREHFLSLNFQSPLEMLYWFLCENPLNVGYFCSQIW